MNGRKQSGGTGAARSMQNKFHAVRTRGYASGHEAERARVLHLLKKAGKIQDLREQVSYELVPAQYETYDRGIGKRGKPLKLGKRCVEKSVVYKADFVYVNKATGETVVEDAKGVRTREYVIKRKLMLWVYGIRIKEV